jgi:glycosyltransferase involved in cell wall biosynthesis
VTPEITAVIPTHNRTHLLPLTLKTVLYQRDVDLEVVVVDDGSEDDVAAVVTAAADRRIHLIRHEHPTGVSTARNHGADVASGSWLAFCDDDDLWAPQKLARQIAAAAENGRTWSYAGAVRIDSANRVMGGTPAPRPDQLVARLHSVNLMPGGSSNVIVRADMFRKAGGWDRGLVNLADWALWIRLAQLGPPAAVAEPLVGYRVHGTNASANTALVVREARTMDHRYGSRVDYGELHYYLAWVCLRSGRRELGFRHLARAALRGHAEAIRQSAAMLGGARLRRLFRGGSSSCPDQVWLQQADAWLTTIRASALAPEPGPGMALPPA